MASHTLPHEPAPRRGLRSRPGLRLLAITLWCAFLGAGLLLLAALAVLPAETASGIEDVSLMFLGAWAIVSVPVALALVLVAGTPRNER